MQAFFKDNKTLIINTMIDNNEKETLLDFIGDLDEITFKKLYDIEGNISGIMFIKTDVDIPSIEVMKGISTVISFNLLDNKNNHIDINDIESLVLSCMNDNDIIFTKNKEDFRFENNKYYVSLTSEDTDLEEGEYDVFIECITPNYNDKTHAKLIVIGSDE